MVWRMILCSSWLTLNYSKEELFLKTQPSVSICLPQKASAEMA